MLEWIVFFIIVLVYIIGVTYLLLRLHDIKNNPRRYNTIQGYDKYLTSKWYWPSKKPYNRTDPPQICRPRHTWLFLGIPFWQFATRELFHMFVIPSNAKSLVMYETIPVAALGIVSIVFGVILSMYLTLSSKHPQDICVSIFDLCKNKQRYKVWKQWTITILVFIMAMFPLRLYSLHNYTYINEETIVYKRMWKYQVFDLDNCDFIFEPSCNVSEVEQITIVNSNGELLVLHNSDIERVADECNAIKQALGQSQ